MIKCIVMFVCSVAIWFAYTFSFYNLTDYFKIGDRYGAFVSPDFGGMAFSIMMISAFIISSFSAYIGACIYAATQAKKTLVYAFLAVLSLNFLYMLYAAGVFSGHRFFTNALFYIVAFSLLDFIFSLGVLILVSKLFDDSGSRCGL